MSKVHLAVLGFINYKPMYGYEILNTISTRKMDIWAGIKMPSVYNALQHLEEKKYIVGEQQIEGNNPPRMVYSISKEGKAYLIKLLNQYLLNEGMDTNFWFALSFVYKTHTFLDFLKIIKSRIDILEQRIYDFKEVHGENMEKCLSNQSIAFIHVHLIRIGQEAHRYNIQILKQLYDDTIKNKDSDIFLKEG